MQSREICHQSFSVAFDYPVVFTRDLFNPANQLLADTADRLDEKRRHRTMVFVDDGVARGHPRLTDRIQAYFAAHADQLELAMPPRVVPGGERIKSDFSLIQEMVRAAIAQRFCRHSCVLAVGGGAMLDAAGFATSLVHRGLRLIRAPTTVLSQNDAGVGVKNAMNLDAVKNAIGVFAPPFAVLNDLDFLASLPDDAWTDGVAEAFKVAIIRDTEFFRFLRENAAALKTRDEKAMEHLVKRCARLHLAHIRESGDPFEFGRARPLDFGHWAAHKLEALSGYRIRHGQAVAIGVAMDSFYAARRQWIAWNEFEAIHDGLTQTGFTLWREELERRKSDGTLEILDGLQDFREHLGGELCVTFPRGIGRRFEVHEIEPALVEDAIQHLKANARTSVDTGLPGARR